MLKQAKEWLFKKYYTFSHDELIDRFMMIEREIRKELQEEYKAKLEEVQNKLNEQVLYTSKIEKDYATLSIDLEIAKAKLQAKSQEEEMIKGEINSRVNNNLITEIFGNETA